MAKQTVTRGGGIWVLKDGGVLPFVEGDEVPDNLADGQLEHKTRAGSFEPPLKQNWQGMADAGIVPGPDNAAGRQEAAEQSVDASTAPESALAPEK